MSCPDDWTFEQLPLPGLLWPAGQGGLAPRPNAAFTRIYSLDSLRARGPALGTLPDGEHVLRLERSGEPWDARVCRLHLATRPGGSRLALVVDLQAEYQDPLTGLEDRRALLLDAGAAPGEGAQGASLALLDIDGFKEVNDTLGHAAGDAALCALAELLGAAARRWGARAYRLGGDEFVVCSPGRLGASELAEVQAQFARHLAAQKGANRRRGLALRSFSYGLADAPQDGRSLPELLRCADARLAGCKDRRRGTQAAQVLRLQDGAAPAPRPELPWPGLSWLPRRKNA